MSKNTMPVMGTADRAFVLSKSQIAECLGSNYSAGDPPKAESQDPVALACSALEAGAADLQVLRHTLASDELDNEDLNMALWRLGNRLEVAADIAWRAHLADQGTDEKTIVAEADAEMRAKAEGSAS